MSNEPIFDICDAPKQKYPLWLQWPVDARIGVPRITRALPVEGVMIVEYRTKEELLFSLATVDVETALQLCED